MILTALKELADQEGLIASPHFEEKAVAYLLHIDPSGRCIGPPQPVSQPPEGKKKTAKRYFLVPRPFPGARRSGTQIDPGFLVGNASFVLGINATGDKDRKNYTAHELAGRQKRFQALIAEAEQATGDEGLRAVRMFLDDLIAGRQRVAVPEALKSNELFAFAFTPDMDRPVHERPPVIEYWSHRRASQASGAGTGSPSFHCLVTNQPCLPVDKHPLIKVPGGTQSGIAFVSFNNKTLESYGLEGSENAPVSRPAAEAYTTALTRLLDDSYPDPKRRTPMPRRNFRLSDDTAVVFWGRGASAELNLFAESLQQADPEAVAALYTATWKGRPVNLQDPSAFYALTLSGGQGRGTVRAWFESTVREALHNVRQHFDDLNIVRPAAEAGRPFPLLQLLRRTAVQGKNENIHPHLAAAVFEAALKGWAYPRMLLDATVRRARAERTIFSDRAALLKAYLVRAKRLGLLIDPDFPEVKPMLDRDCPAPAYRLGRLFAVLEKVQADATNAGTTIRDRYYGAASATPVVVFGQLLRKAPHHLAKLDHAPFYEKLIQEIMCALQPPSPFPAALSLEEQGLFAVGYYHQRKDLFTKRSGETGAKGKDGEEDKDNATTRSEGE
jgi:CRISPR-associated protein Csd1